MSNCVGISTLSISPDGKLVLAGSSTGVHAQMRGKDLLPLETPLHLSEPVYSLAFSPDGKSFAFNDGSHVSICDIETGQLTRYVGELDHHTHPVAFSPGGSKIA